MAAAAAGSTLDAVRLTIGDCYDDSLFAEGAGHAVVWVHGPVHERYLCGPRDTADPAAWRTEIGWPIFRVAAESSGPRGRLLHGRRGALVGDDAEMVAVQLQHPRAPAAPASSAQVEGPLPDAHPAAREGQVDDARCELGPHGLRP